MFKNAKKIIIAVLVLVVIMTMMACSLFSNKNDIEQGNDNMIKSDTLNVKKVNNLSNDFIFGMDASAVPSLELGGVRYYDYDGKEKDVYQILSESGINYIRVRVWNNPYDNDGNGYGGGNCDIENAIEIGKRATKHGMKLLINFHYSDFWADPSKQMVPKAWKDMSIEQKTDALYRYTKECLEKLKTAGVDVGMVQVGNETNGGMCGEWSDSVNGWKRITQLMSAGSKAVRDVFSDALVVIHFSNPENVQSYEEYSSNLDYYGVDYDIFASSYYPFWHGTLENLANVLNKVTAKYGKKVMVAETSYAYTPNDTDYFGNTLSESDGFEKKYPYTIQGQADHVRDVIDTVVNKVTDGIGVFYWEGTWISSGGDSYEENFALWQKYGSGWATSYASEYDSNDAGKWYGGCTVDNQALFDKNGRALESLKVFSLVKQGNEIKGI